MYLKASEVEQIIKKSLTAKRVSKSIIDQLAEEVVSVMKATAKPGDIRERRDGKYQKQPDGSWKRMPRDGGSSSEGQDGGSSDGNAGELDGAGPDAPLTQEERAAGINVMINELSDEDIGQLADRGELDKIIDEYAKRERGEYQPDGGEGDEPQSEASEGRSGETSERDAQDKSLVEDAWFAVGQVSEALEDGRLSREKISEIKRPMEYQADDMSVEELREELMAMRDHIDENLKTTLRFSTYYEIMQAKKEMES